MKRKQLVGIIIILILATAAFIAYKRFFSQKQTLADPLWDEIHKQGSGITVSGTVIYAKDKEFIIDVVREDAPTSRAPSLYFVGDTTKIWEKNKWQELKKAPPVGTLLMMYIPFQQEAAGIFIDKSYQYVFGKVAKWDNDTITINKANYSLKDVYLENKTAANEAGNWAILSLQNGKVQYAEIWPEEMSHIPKAVETARKRWLEAGFRPKDIDVVWDEGWVVTGYQHPFKDQLNQSKRLFFTPDAKTIKAEKDLLAFNELEMQIEFRDKIYAYSGWEELLDEATVDIAKLEVAGENYLGEIYYYLEQDLSCLYTRPFWNKKAFKVWKEVIGDVPYSS